jgi:hypothetical protein
MEDRWQTHLWRGAQAGRDRRVHSLPASSTTGGSEQAAENRGFERPGGEEMRRLLRKNGSGKSSVLPEVHNEQRWEEQARIISAPLFCVVENWKQQRAWAVGYGPWVRSVFLKKTHTHTNERFRFCFGIGQTTTRHLYISLCIISIVQGQQDISI